MNVNITKIKLSKLPDSFKIFTLIFLCLGFQFSRAQDDCASALPITAGTTVVPMLTGSNINTACSSAVHAEWYSYTPTQNYSVTVTSDLAVNICKDTHFMVYTGNCGSLTCYSGDDDSGVIACNTGSATSYLSVATFDVVAGTTYYITWDDRWMAAGFEFQLIEAPFVPSPCLSAIPVTAGITTVDMIDGGNVTTTCSNASMAKWYSYVPSSNYTVTISSDLIQNICKDTNFSVYTGSCSGSGGLTCVTSDDNSGVIACNIGNTNSNLSKRTFDVSAGTTYYIVWDNKWSADGFDFQITEQPIVIPVTYTSQTISTINSQYNLCVVDMNGDGKDDLAGVSPNNLRIHYQNDGGTFTIADYPVSGASNMPTWSLAAGDLNKDGFNDLLLGNGSGLTFWQSNSTGSGYSALTPGQYIFCQRTNFVDINNDGNLDAFSCHDVNPNVYYLNNGAGGYTYYQSGITPGAYSLGVTPSGGNYASLWTDYDNDGDVDMFISKCSGPPCELHRNDGNGVFTDVSVEAGINFQPVQSWSSAIADFDNDGDMDILVGSNGGVGSRLFRNNLDTTNTTEEAFTDITAGSGFDISTTTNRDYIAYDFDNDGFVDVLGGGNKIMFNKGNMNFAPTTYSNVSVGAVGDLNEDGFLDILNGNTIRYAVPNGNHWLTVRLNTNHTGTNSNGIGARIEIYGAWGKQIREIRSGEGFGYMSSLNGHFGLGAATTIDKIIVRWPSGTVDTVLNPAIDHGFDVTEGAFPLKTIDFTTAGFSIYPNPADDVLNVQLSKGMIIKTAQVFDITGKMILNNVYSNDTIPVKDLQSGTYILKLNDGSGKQYTQKFIKK